jgi:hypothetical protein
MDNKENIPYIVYEATQARSERTIKKLIIALVISIILMFATNAIWLYAWCQYDYSSEETSTITTVDGKDGTANYIGNNGDIHNGENHSSKNSEEKKTN